MLLQIKHLRQLKIALYCMGVFIKDTKVKEIEMYVKKMFNKNFHRCRCKILVCGRFNDRKNSNSAIDSINIF
jgi:hypothetical protein